jgi:tetratricopeptide (TPR) repeat protein
MDLEQRLKQLESVHDWHGVVEALEQGIAAAGDASAKASLHLRLGRILRGRFLQGVRALKHFQDAYKLNPALIEALSEARRVYWDLGKLNMVQKLIELQLKGSPDAPTRTALLRELGDVLCEVGEYDRAAESYAKALQSADGKPGDLPEMLQDAQASGGDWQDRMGTLLRAAHSSDDVAKKASLFLRAARLVRRFAPEEAEGVLAQAYAADPTDHRVAATYEGVLVEANRTDAILEAQRGVLSRVDDTRSPRTRSARAGRSATRTSRWALSSWKRPCASIPRVKRRSRSCATSTACEGAIGIA